MQEHYDGLLARRKLAKGFLAGVLSYFFPGSPRGQNIHFSCCFWKGPWNAVSESWKGQCPDYAHAPASSVFSSKDNRTVILIRQDFLPDRTADGSLLFTFSSDILDFWWRLSSYRIRELRQWRRRRPRKRHLKSEFALPKTLSRLFHLV